MAILKILVVENQQIINTGGFMRKKLLVYLMIGLLLILLIGCASDEKSIDEASNQVDVAVEAEPSYTYTYEDVTIELDAEAEPLLTQLGEENSYFESESCAFPGLDKIYTYPGIEIQTYEQDGVDHIISIGFLDDTIATNEGIRLFDSLSKVEEVYGDDYTEASGLYTYRKGNTTLSFLVKDDEVISIEYSLIVSETD